MNGNDKNEINIAIVEELDDNDVLLDQCDLAVCLEATEENIAQVPPMWLAEIGYGECGLCGTKIFFRTNLPAEATKACMRCAMEAMAEDENPMLITRKSAADELRDYLKKKEQN